MLCAGVLAEPLIGMSGRRLGKPLIEEEEEQAFSSTTSPAAAATLKPWVNERDIIVSNVRTIS